MAHPLYVSPYTVVAVDRGGGICEMLISRSRFDLGVAGGVILRNAGIIQCNRVFMLLEYKPISFRTPSCLAVLETSELNHWSPCIGTPGTLRRWRGLRFEQAGGFIALCGPSSAQSDKSRSLCKNYFLWAFKFGKVTPLVILPKIRCVQVRNVPIPLCRQNQEQDDMVHLL